MASLPMPIRWNILTYWMPIIISSCSIACCSRILPVPVLYDGINQKGFEGDLVLNGFAEFIRNLLVCKDAKAATCWK